MVDLIEQMKASRMVAPEDDSRISAAYQLKDLFRKEAVDGSHERFGLPVRLVGVSGWILSFFFIASLCVAVAFLITARYARKETVSGYVVPVEGALRITSQIAGVAAQVMVHEGQLVNAGDELVAVSTDPMLDNGSSLAVGLKEIQTAQSRAQELQASARLQQVQSAISELTARREGLSTDLSRLADAAAILSKRQALQAQTLAAHRSLLTQGMVSPIMVRQQEDALLGLDQQIQQVERSVALQRSELAQTLPRLQRLHAEADMARSESATLKAQLSEKQLNSSAQLSRRLVAPIAGVVTALQARPGNPVANGQTLAIIVPSTGNTAVNRLEVELWAPSRAIGFVKPGAKVRIMYEAFPYATFGVGQGVVRDIAGAPVTPNDLPVPIETHEQLFRIRVALDQPALTAYQREWPLVPGMRLSADLILEEQTLFEWILAPVRALQHRTI